MDHWYADCAPCKLAVPHETEDEAIATAEQHIAIAHAHTSALARAAAGIGTVQNRTDTAIAAPVETAPADTEHGMSSEELAAAFPAHFTPAPPEAESETPAGSSGDSFTERLSRATEGSS